MSVMRIGNLIEFVCSNGDKYLGVLGHLYLYPANSDSTIPVTEWHIKLLADKGIDETIINEMLSYIA